MAAIFVGVVAEALDGPVEGYDDILSEVLTEIRRAETEAVQRSNSLTVELYSRVGRVIVARQRDETGVEQDRYRVWR